MAEYFDQTADQAYDNYSPNDRVSVFGGADDLWGLDEVTRGQLADPNFKIKFDADVGAGKLRADQVKVEIFYQVNEVGVQNEPIYPEHSVDTPYADGDIVWAIADDGISHKYVATGPGTSGSVAPVFPSWTETTVVDGGITWTEAGQYQPASLPPYYQSSLLAGAIGRDADGRTIFLVAGQSGIVKTSHDGENWTERETGVAVALRGVAAGENGFVAVGDNGTIISSPDGITWTPEQSEAKDSLYSVDYDRTKGSFVAVGKDGLIQHKSNAGWNSVNR